MNHAVQVSPRPRSGAIGMLVRALILALLITTSFVVSAQSTELSLGMGHRSHGSKQEMSHKTMQGSMSMGSGQSSENARSPDYSDGLAYGPMKGPHLAGDKPLGRLLIDQLEYTHGKDGGSQTWEAQGWYGYDTNKLWVRTEGERSHGRRGDVELFWNHNIAAFWSTQLGGRYDIGDGPGRPWAAFGIQGLAPYWFNLEATGYIGPSGRTAARFLVEYELLFTQRLILQSEAEINFYGKDDPARHIGSGLSDVELGLRLRYEIRRQFAPYIGIVWTGRFGVTGYRPREAHQSFPTRQFVAGLRIWF